MFEAWEQWKLSPAPEGFAIVTIVAHFFLLWALAMLFWRHLRGIQLRPERVLFIAMAMMLVDDVASTNFDAPTWGDVLSGVSAILLTLVKEPFFWAAWPARKSVTTS